SARLLHDVVVHREMEDVSAAADALAEQDVELAVPERPRDLVLHDLDPHPVTDRVLARLERGDATDVEPLRGVELERVAARGRLRATEHHVDLHADLVDEEERAVALLHRAGELAERLA